MIEIRDFGLSEYEEILNLQQHLFDCLVSQKKSGSSTNEFILAGSHHPVITLGRRAVSGNLLVNNEFLNHKGIKVFNIGRGGDITYHCPGQLIIYPILDLEAHGLGVKDYVAVMEDSVIQLLNEYGILADKIEGATGVWLGKDTPEERKICAIGIKCSRFCSMHGLALNVDCDLSGFSWINPCGFKDKGVTSMALELDIPINFETVEHRLIKILTDKLSSGM